MWKFSGNNCSVSFTLLRKQIFFFYVIAEEQDALQSTATSTTATATKKRKRRPGKCHTCGEPMLGHNAAECKSKK